MQNASHIFQLVHARTAPVACTLMGAVLACAGVMAAPAALAQEAPQPRVERQQPPRDLQREMQQREMQQREMLRQEQRAYEEQQRRILQAQQEQQQEGQRRHGRMTADERSELRRQINEANQDIYARPRGRR
ncbi:MAG TPA: hypothetical protein VGE60_06550 [Telluria sp.]